MSGLRKRRPGFYKNYHASNGKKLEVLILIMMILVLILILILILILMMKLMTIKSMLQHKGGGEAGGGNQFA